MPAGSIAIISRGAGTIGQSLPRREDAALLTGAGRFADDLGIKPGTLHCAVLRSPHAHARLLGLDTAAALALPGVRAVLTGEDVRQWSAPFVSGIRQPMQHWCVAVERVRYVGEPVALVVATDRYVAEDAVDLIDVQYEALPAVIGIERALAPDAPLLHDEIAGNLASDRRFSYGDPGTAFAGAARNIGLTIEYPRNSCTPIECGVVVADYCAEDGGFDVLSNFMGPYSLHAVMALALKVPGARLRLRNAPDSGGSFGVKQALFTSIVAVCLASRKARAPVKWVEDRLEHLQAATSATARRTRIEAAVSADGRMVALDYDQTDDCGAYLRAPEPATLYRMHGTLTGAYDIAHLRVRNRVALTNSTPTGLVRGFGGPQMYFALERLVDRIAVELGLDPLEVRRRNLVRAFPYRAAAGAVLDSGDYAGMIGQACTAARHDELLARRALARAEGRFYGIGYAAVVEPSISNMGYVSNALTADERERAGPKNGAIATATVNVDPLGSVAVIVASTPAGQGHATVLAQVVAEALGLAPDDITVNVELDTQKDAWSVAAGNYSSRFAGAVAGAAHLAAIRIRNRMARRAAHELGVAVDAVEFAEGALRVRGDKTRMLAFRRVAGTFHWSPASLQADESPALRETAWWTPPTLSAPDADDRVNASATYGFVFDICAVEVERATGRVRVDRYVSVHDAGRLLNPALADGQIRGGFAQGVGAALYEEFVYADDGALLSGTFADYLVPTARETPELTIAHCASPSPVTPLGAKGIGEGSNMSTPVAVANAVADALGVRDVRLPLTPRRVIELIADEEPAPPQDATDRAAVGKSGKTLAASGEALIHAAPEQVFAALTDPALLAKVIPGCSGMTMVGKHQYRAEVTLGAGPVRARFAAEIRLTGLEPPHRLVLEGQGTSALGAARGTGAIALTAVGDTTRLEYEYRTEVGGRIAAVGARMLEGAARATLAGIFARLDAMLAPPGNKAGWWRRFFGGGGQSS